MSNHSFDYIYELLFCLSYFGEYRPDNLSFFCVSAGFILKQMGLPLKLVAMVNSNDIVHRTVTTGDFSMAPNVTQTLAPAIDIQVLLLLMQLCFTAGLIWAVVIG